MWKICLPIWLEKKIECSFAEIKKGVSYRNQKEKNVRTINQVLRKCPQHGTRFQLVIVAIQPWSQFEFVTSKEKFLGLPKHGFAST